MQKMHDYCIFIKMRFFYAQTFCYVHTNCDNVVSLGIL